MTSDSCQVIESRLVDPQKLMEALEKKHGKDSFSVEVHPLQQTISRYFTQADFVKTS